MTAELPGNPASGQRQSPFGFVRRKEYATGVFTHVKERYGEAAQLLSRSQRNPRPNWLRASLQAGQGRFMLTINVGASHIDGCWFGAVVPADFGARDSFFRNFRHTPNSLSRRAYGI